MNSETLDQLLHLQTLDQNLQKKQALLASIAPKIAGIEKQIQSEQEATEDARQQLNQLTIEHKDLENQVQQNIDKINQYKTQQLSVKKNEEYQALDKEMAHLAEQNDQLEEQAINTLIAIDAAQETFDQAKALIDQNIDKYQDDIKQQQQHAATLEQELAQESEDITQHKTQLPSKIVSEYERIATSTSSFPYVAEVRKQTCSGCHLKVSNELLSELRQDRPIHYCDQCVRIVYSKN